MGDHALAFELGRAVTHRGNGRIYEHGGQDLGGGLRFGEWR